MLLDILKAGGILLFFFDSFLSFNDHIKDLLYLAKIMIRLFFF